MNTEDLRKAARLWSVRSGQVASRSITEAADEVDRLRGRESQLEAQIETLEVIISRLRCVCDAAFTLVREFWGPDDWTGTDDGEAAKTAWQELVSALEDARYEPRDESL